MIADELRALAEEWFECCNDIHVTLFALADRVAELERDAARYRWLRDADSPLCIYRHDGLVDSGMSGVADVGEIISTAEADAIIDATMKDRPNE